MLELLHFAIQTKSTFLISDIRALWRSALSARVPECQKLKMAGLALIVLNTKVLPYNEILGFKELSQYLHTYYTMSTEL